MHNISGHIHINHQTPSPPGQGSLLLSSADLYQGPQGLCITTVGSKPCTLISYHCLWSPFHPAASWSLGCQGTLVAWDLQNMVLKQTSVFIIVKIPMTGWLEEFCFFWPSYYFLSLARISLSIGNASLSSAWSLLGCRLSWSRHSIKPSPITVLYPSDHRDWLGDGQHTQDGPGMMGIKEERLLLGW